MICGKERSFRWLANGYPFPHNPSPFRFGFRGLRIMRPGGMKGSSLLLTLKGQSSPDDTVRFHGRMASG